MVLGPMFAISPELAVIADFEKAGLIRQSNNKMLITNRIIKYIDPVTNLVVVEIRWWKDEFGTVYRQTRFKSETQKDEDDFIVDVVDGNMTKKFM